MTVYRSTILFCSVFYQGLYYHTLEWAGWDFTKMLSLQVTSDSNLLTELKKVDVMFERAPSMEAQETSK